MPSPPRETAPPRSVTRVAAVSCLLLAVVLVAAQCGGKPVTVLQTEGVRLRRVEVREHAEQANGVVRLPGDWVFEGNALHVVVGGLRRSADMRGAVLEVTRRAGDEDESIEYLAPRLLVDNRSYPVEVREMRVLERRGHPVLRVDGRVRTAEHDFDVSRELAVSSGSTALSITTRVEAQDERAVQVTLGQRIAWGGDAPWVPGVGVLDDDRWHDASFVGSEGLHVGTVFGVQDSSLHLVARYEQHGAMHFIEHTDVFSRPRPSARRAPAYEQSTFVLGNGDLGEAVRQFGWAKGSPFPEALVVLPYSPAGAVITVFTHEGHLPVVHARPDEDGRTIVPLPPLVQEPRDLFTIVASAFGHATSDEAVASVRVPTRTVVDIPRGGRVRISARDASTGAPLLARARIISAEREHPVNLGPDYAADGAGDSVVLKSGEAVVPLPAGRYRVLVTHGPEWTLLDTTVDVTETFRPDVRAQLSHVVDPGSWVPCDFHLHASPSPDSHVTLEDRILSLSAEGIRFAVPTDHNHVTDYGPAIASTQAPSFGTLSGVELTTDQPIFGHFNVYPLTPDPTLPGNGAPPFQATSPVTLFPLLRQLGPDVLVQVNHPRLEGEIGYWDRAGFDPVTGYATQPYSDDYDVVEVWNGFDLARQPSFDRVFTEWQAMLTRGRHVSATGNSDSHLVRYQWPGYPRTYVNTPSGVNDPRALVRALKEGRAFVTSGPFLDVRIGEQGPGDTATLAEHRAHVHVTVRAPEWMDVSTVELWSQGAVIGTWSIAPLRTPPPRRGNSSAPAPVSPIRTDRELDVEFANDAYLVVLVRGDRPMDDYFGRNSIPPMAFSNPIWIDADGDGQGPIDSGDPGNAPRDAGVLVDAGTD